MNLKIQACLLADQSVSLRRISNRLLRNAKRVAARKSNSYIPNTLFNEVYAERMRVRKEARVLHLSRAYLSGRPYQQLEEICYEPVPIADICNLLMGGMDPKDYHDWTINYNKLFADVKVWATPNPYMGDPLPFVVQ